MEGVGGAAGAGAEGEEGEVAYGRRRVRGKGSCEFLIEKKGSGGRV